MELSYGTDYSYWYDVDEMKLHDTVQVNFKKHYYDNETEEFIVDACNISYFKHVFDNTVSLFLLPFVSATSRNALLNRGIMFVASSDLFAEMLAYTSKCDSLLDIGAGCGNVTIKFSNMFQNVFVTENSPTMRQRLLSKEFVVLEVENWTSRTYDVISCLNVLDRCHEPMKLLRDIYCCLSQAGGTALIALVLPYHGSVEEGQAWQAQRDPLPIKGESFEEQLSSFVIDVLEPLGFELNLVTKVPYLCTGDLHAKYYSLSDCLLSLNVKPSISLPIA
jgi:2-polyprenyl-3-methyl-5-hydroxy-6-metoxy-1,4-benzoquinol methylase